MLKLTKLLELQLLFWGTPIREGLPVVWDFLGRDFSSDLLPMSPVTLLLENSPSCLD